MIRRLLIANRGEIVRRIMRTCRQIGVESVAIYSDVDAGAAHVKDADAAERVGPAPASQSYLNIPNVIDAATRSGADAMAQTLKSLDEIRYALDQAAIVAATDHRGIITYVNDKFCDISKYSRQELLGADHRIINSGYHP